MSINPNLQETKINGGILVAVLALVFSFYTYRQLLPLHQANVVFSEPDLEIIPSQPIRNNEIVDVIQPKFRNIGEAAATNVKLKIYGIFFDDKIMWDDKKSSRKLFDFKLIHHLEPKTAATFGYFELPHTASRESKVRDLSEEGQQVALIFHLEYTESITHMVQNKVFMFQHVMGGSRVNSLINQDYGKIYNRLINELKKSEPNGYLVKFLAENTP